ncbi:MAG: hypothetical protein RPU39_17850 [Candidatus Sedimenticola sp. (ex Thyasira tokunagai)]
MSSIQDFIASRAMRNAVVFFWLGHMAEAKKKSETKTYEFTKQAALKCIAFSCMQEFKSRVSNRRALKIHSLFIGELPKAAYCVKMSATYHGCGNRAGRAEYRLNFDRSDKMFAKFVKGSKVSFNTLGAFRSGLKLSKSISTSGLEPSIGLSKSQSEAMKGYDQWIYRAMDSRLRTEGGGMNRVEEQIGMRLFKKHDRVPSFLFDRFMSILTPEVEFAIKAWESNGKPRAAGSYKKTMMPAFQSWLLLLYGHVTCYYGIGGGGWNSTLSKRTINQTIFSKFEVGLSQTGN